MYCSNYSVVNALNSGYLDEVPISSKVAFLLDYLSYMSSFVVRIGGKNASAGEPAILDELYPWFTLQSNFLLAVLASKHRTVKRFCITKLISYICYLSKL